MIFHANTLSWELVEEKDGWVSIYEIDPITFTRTSCIQAVNMEHAKSYCVMREPLPFPWQRLC